MLEVFPGTAYTSFAHHRAGSNRTCLMLGESVRSGQYFTGSVYQDCRLSGLDTTAQQGAQQRDLVVVISSFVEVLAIAPRNLTDEEKIT